MQGNKEIAFGAFKLDLSNECLWQGTQSISLRPKAFAVLKLLVENAGRLVTKQEVLDRVWPGTFVGDAVLKDNVRQLREALNDNAASPVYIETSHRRGYRFIGMSSDRLMSVTHDKNARTLQSAPGPLSFVPKQPEILGREPELAKMGGLLHRALAGERQLLFVTGEPGIGKTTLVQAFLGEAAQSTNLRVARGQCLEHYGAGEAYLPVLDAFSRLCRSPQGYGVLNVLREQAPSWLAQMPTLLPQLERDNILSRSFGATRERMLREIGDAIETLTSESPLLLVFEDLHWSDYSTVECLSYLARRPDPARLMAIGTYRPVDVILSDHPIKGVKRELQPHGLCDEIALEYLTEDAVSQYLVARFPDNRFPFRLRRAIHRRTEGNPLFMVTFVQYLLDQEIIVQDNGTWKLAVDLNHVEHGVPSNLRQLIETQIDRLSPDERMVLEAASVAGMECSSVAIAAALDKPVEWVEQHCEELARRHQFLSPAWLVELPDGTVTPRHRFIHVLYREVPYRLMPLMRRSQTHHRIAERGIVIYGDRTGEIAAELAMHFEQSHDWPRAVEYILQAAENAATHSAHHEAIDLANRGLEALKSISDTAERAKQEMKLRMILSASLTATKGFASADAEEINARGRELFWRHGPSPELFYMLWSLNMYHQFSGDMHSSLTISNQLMQLAKDLNNDTLVMEAHRTLGAVLNLLGRCSESLEHLEMGKALAAAHYDRRDNIFTNFDSKVMFECFAALALLALGYPDKSEQRVTAGLALARELGHPQTLVLALHIAAQLYHWRRDAPMVLVHAKEAMTLAEEYGLTLWAAYGLIEVGSAEADLGDVQGGIETMRRGLAEYELTRTKLRCPYFFGLLADRLGQVGRVEEGLPVIKKALSVAGQTGERWALPDLHRIQGELFFNSSKLLQPGTPRADSHLSQARACFEEALIIAKQQGTRWWQLRAALSMDRLEMSQGKWDHMELAEAYSFFTEGFDTADLKQARAQLSAAPPVQVRPAVNQPSY